MTFKRIAIISLPVSDQAVAKTFYTETLGFKVLRDNPMGPDQRWIQIAPDDGGTSLTLVTWLDKMPPGSVQGLVLDTDDIDADRDALAARGLEITEVGDTPWGRFAMFQDPDGNGWVLQQATED